jgi:hypothetical protein
MSVAAKPASFLAWALYSGSGLLIWVAQFLAGYIATALACARGLVDPRPVAIAVSVCAALACAGVLRHAVARMRQTFPEDEARRFLHRVAAVVAGVSLVAIGWTALAGALPLQCAPGS